MGATIINILAIAFWPLVAFAILLAWRKRKWLSTAPAHKSIPAVFAPAMIFMFVFLIMITATATGMFVAYTVWMTIGVGIIALAINSLRVETRIKSQKMKRLGAIVGSAIGLTMVLLVGSIEGVIDRLEMSGGGPIFYRVYIDGKRYSTTADIYDTLEENKRMRAEVGGSHIFRIERLPDMK